MQVGQLVNSNFDKKKEKERQRVGKTPAHEPSRPISAAASTSTAPSPFPFALPVARAQATRGSDDYERKPCAGASLLRAPACSTLLSLPLQMERCVHSAGRASLPPPRPQPAPGAATHPSSHQSISPSYLLAHARTRRPQGPRPSPPRVPTPHRDSLARADDYLNLSQQASTSRFALLGLAEMFWLRCVCISSTAMPR
jgi:hypothetical protein